MTARTRLQILDNVCAAIGTFGVKWRDIGLPIASTVTTDGSFRLDLLSAERTLAHPYRASESDDQPTNRAEQSAEYRALCDAPFRLTNQSTDKCADWYSD